MRKKIAKRRRRECLRRGLVVTEHKHYPERSWINVLLCAEYKGHKMSCLAYDDLEAWQMARESMDFTDEMEARDD